MPDELLLGVAIFPNSEAAGWKNRNVAMAETLNHHLWFYDPSIKIDQWMVGERGTSWGADGRVLVHQTVWDQRGRLLMTCVREALVRLKDSHL